jgi:UDP-N-acetylmuramate--alanine ligase
MTPGPHPHLTGAIPDPDQLGRVHFIGIGGAGMSGIARIMLARGLPVTGSDAKDSAGLAALRALGATVAVGHRAAQVVGAGTVVVSTAVRPNNPELVQARAEGIPVLHRSQALAAVMRGRRGIAVGGTAGKTTTTSMIAVALQHCGADPSFAIGGELAEGGANAHDGTGEVFVAEADESDGSFLLYHPEVAVVTNVEPDHLDFYGTAEAVETAFADFCATVTPGGLIVACLDDPGARRIVEHAADGAAARGVQIIGYGRAADAAVRVEGLRATAAGVSCTLVDAHGPMELQLRVPGEHNGLNAAAAYGAITGLGFDRHLTAAGLAGFGGTRRRFEFRGEAGGVRVVDDYAHHPTKVAAALQAARSVVGSGRVLAVFQPHLYSRTRIFAADFGRALGLADEVVVMDVYAAREDPEPGVTGALVAAEVPLPAERVTYQPSWSRVAAQVVGRARPGDLVLTIGAGDVTMLGPEILEQLRTASQSGRPAGGRPSGHRPG